MNNKMLRFEFDFEEVFEGIKEGVIRELSEVRLGSEREQAIKDTRRNIQQDLSLSEKELKEIRNNIVKKVTDLVTEETLAEVRIEIASRHAELYAELHEKANDFRESLEERIVNQAVNKVRVDVRGQVTKQISETIATIFNQQNIKAPYRFDDCECVFECDCHY